MGKEERGGRLRETCFLFERNVMNHAPTAHAITFKNTKITSHGWRMATDLWHKNVKILSQKRAIKMLQLERKTNMKWRFLRLCVVVLGFF